MASAVRKAKGSAKPSSKIGLSFSRPDSTSSCTPSSFEGSRLRSPSVAERADGAGGIWPARAFGWIDTLGEVLDGDCGPAAEVPQAASATPVAHMATPARKADRVDRPGPPTGRVIHSSVKRAARRLADYRCVPIRGNPRCSTSAANAPRAVTGCVRCPLPCAAPLREEPPGPRCGRWRRR
jgi:hypothetical protein